MKKKKTNWSEQNTEKKKITIDDSEIQRKYYYVCVSVCMNGEQRM